MKVLLINCSPHAHGCTDAALTAAETALRDGGIDTIRYWTGTDPIQPCTACGGCGKTGRCVHEDGVNEVIDRMAECDGLIVGTPVHYAAPSGAASVFLDRLVFAGGAVLRHKPAAGIAVCRRAGATGAFDDLNKYFTIAQMPVVSSQYWNMVFGTTPEEIHRDAEGMQTMRTLARNMTWLLKCIDAGRAAGILPPEPEKQIRTNFIR